MLSTITILSAKDIHFLQSYRSLSWAERQYQAVKDAFNSRIVAVKHLADFWCVEPEDIITQLQPRFGIVPSTGSSSK